MIGVMNFDKCCVISAESFEALYSPSKVYLGRNNTLPQKVTMSIEFDFNTKENLSKFFIFWRDKTSNGAKPFYVKLPLYGESKFVLISLVSELKQQSQVLSGTFRVYTHRTLDENTPPVFHDKLITTQMDSTSNYILFQAEDFDNVTYEIVNNPIGVVKNVGGGAFYYTPTDGFSGVDSFTVKATDELGTSTEATLTINVINWQLAESFKMAVTLSELLIEYANADNVDPQIQADLLSLANTATSYDTDENLLLDYTNATTITNITIDADNNLIITTQGA